ncbi:hypothetical protein SCP_1004270 [Sparassis crispa]|uniref:Uncharacterized protein n=1 Tax=Sparassis crispa TaxID=139825 RepID=A0A401GYB9_9APHY|nr:hypothetical protein SCP_1004270 [Sparassis crispa]GBE87180.1 hypothetical protein SCP_1004270 [Sparassis crispa]
MASVAGNQLPTCYKTRCQDGTYDRIMAQLSKSLDQMLALKDYPADFAHTTNRKGHYEYYSTGDNPSEFSALIIGQVMVSEWGTDLYAKGNFRPYDDNKITDDTAVQNTLVLCVPSQATTDLTEFYYDQIGTLNDIRMMDEKEEEIANFRVTEWIRPSSMEPGKPSDLIIVTIADPKYTTHTNLPIKAAATATPKVEHIKKKRTANAEAEKMQDVQQELTKPTGDDIRIGANYDPHLLPDYGGDLFDHQKARLHQHDFRGVDGMLIPPWDWFTTLWRGTLVLLNVQAHNLCVLSESNEFCIIPRPTLGPIICASTHSSNPPAAFTEFDASPPKKAKADVTKEKVKAKTD